jgi:hypothetical protein
MKEQFSGASTEDTVAHLNNFVELCEMQKYMDVESDIIKLKLFPFYLIGKAKDWLLSLTRYSIDSWAKCKDAFIGRYYPPAKIISLHSNIIKFSQFDNEHIAQAWERMKSMIKKLPHSWTDYLDDCPNFLCRTEFFFRKPIGFSYWRHFYVPYLGRRNQTSRQHDCKLF